LDLRSLPVGDHPDSELPLKSHEVNI
jgi:hypothetical protein